jgi:hypothetical protein
MRVNLVGQMANLVKQRDVSFMYSNHACIEHWCIRRDVPSAPCPIPQVMVL